MRRPMRGLLGDEGVDDRQHAHGDQHVGQPAEGRQLVGDEQQRPGDDHVAGNKEDQSGSSSMP